jgi:copper transport protein
VILALVVTGSVGGATLAWAHQTLVSADPASESQLEQAPTELRLTFHEPVRLPFTVVELFAPDGSQVPLGEPRHSAESVRTLVVQVGDLTRSGSHTIRWRTTGADGHPVEGAHAFDLLPVALESEATAPHAADSAHEAVPEGGFVPPPLLEHSFDASSWPFVLTRWISLLALTGLLGVLIFRIAVLAAAGRSSDAVKNHEAGWSGELARLGFWCAILLLLATPARLVLQAAGIRGELSVPELDLLASVASTGAWGTGWMLQAMGVPVAIVGFRLATRGHRFGWALAAVGGVGLALVPALSGHAAGASAAPLLTIPANAVHVIGAGGWMGGLFALLAVGVPAALRDQTAGSREGLVALVRAFSPVALVCAALMVGTGTFMAAANLGNWPALLGSEYGRGLLLKGALVVAVLALGARNALLVKPGLDEAGGAERLRRTAGIELGAGLVVLLVTAALVALPLPR